MGGSGSWHGPIPDTDRKRLDELLSKLPEDRGRLPPLPRRVLLQVPEGEHSRARVYDLANAPDEVLEILRLSQSGIRSWAWQFKPEKDLTVGDATRNGTRNGLLALTPNRQLVFAVHERPLTFWDPATRKKLKEIPAPRNMFINPFIPTCIRFSPDGSLAVLPSFGGACVVDAKNWKVLQDLHEPRVGRYGGALSFPQFSADGRFLLFLRHRPDGHGHTDILPRAYDTKAWKEHDHLSGLPDDALMSIELPSGKRAVVILKGNVVTLWDLKQHRQYAKLDEDVLVRQVAYSPDEAMVATATFSTRPDKSRVVRPVRIRIWDMATGRMVHELRPFEQDWCENVVGLQWTADGQYILAATKAHFFFTNCDINVWNAKSGRHRGNLSEGVSDPMGIVMLPDGRHIAVGHVGGDGCIIRFWDFAAALKQIRMFEDSLAEPKTGK
jgi:WD40 repeat protein